MESKYENPIFAEAIFMFCTENDDYEIRRMLEPLSMLEWVTYFKSDEFEEWIRNPGNGYDWLTLALK